MPRASKPLTFKEHPVATTFVVACVSNFIVSMWICFVPSVLRAASMDSVHSVAVHYRGGATYFFSPAVASYLDASFIVPVALILVGIGWTALRSALRKRAD